MAQSLWILLMVALFVRPSSDVPRHTPGATTAGDSLYPHLGNGGYDVQHYALDLTWNDQTDVLHGTATLDIVATQALSAFTLDLVGLTVTHVAVDGQDAIYQHQGRKLTITPPQPIDDAQAFAVRVRYEGVPQPDANSGAGTPRGWVRGTHGVFVVSEPSGAATWFPCNDHPTDKATFTLRLTVPAAYTVAASGLRQRIDDHGETRTHIWETRDLTATYLYTANIGNYIEQTRTGYDGLPMRSYFVNTPRGYTISRQDDGLDAMIEVFSEMIAPFPFEAYGFLVTHDFPRANEMQTLPVFNTEAVGERVQVHELAHQWYGNAVTLGDWGDIWLNEGFATYMEYLYVQAVYGAEANTIFNATGYARVQTMRPPKNVDPNNLFDGSVYWRGGWTLHALRLRIGDAAFFTFMRTYYQRFAGSHATTDDLIALAESISGQDLGDFFQGWLFEPAPPPVPEMGLG